jgi:hypothetical protein
LPGAANATAQRALLPCAAIHAVLVVENAAGKGCKSTVASIAAVQADPGLGAAALVRLGRESARFREVVVASRSPKSAIGVGAPRPYCQCGMRVNTQSAFFQC